MRASLSALTRCTVSLAVGAIAGILTAMLLGQYATPVGIVLATCAAAFGGWVGSELAQRRRGRWHGRHLVMWTVCLGVASFAYGILLVLLTPTGVWISQDVLIAWSLLLAPVALYGLVGGLLAGPRGWPALWVDGFVALLVVLAGAAGLALGAGLYVAATYISPCMPHRYGYRCLDPGRWFSLEVGLLGAAAGGLWLGLTLYLALGASGALRPRSSAQTPTQGIATVEG